MGNTISLSDKSKSLIDKYLTSGTYQNANEVIEHSLVALQAEQDKKEALRMAIKEGEESGISEGFNFSDFRKEMTDKYKK